MLHRIASDEVRRALAEAPVVALLGPRQVGKTTLARQIAESLGPGKATYVDLESPSGRARLSDPEAYLETQQGRLVILDEIHRAPGIFSVLRGVVDKRRAQGMRSGQFLVLGSASLDLLRQSSESLAGRVHFIEMTPVRIEETDGDTAAINTLWLRGGFPDSLLASADAPSLTWRRNFIKTYLERDVPALGPRIPDETLRRFWTMLAHNQGQQLNASRLAASLGVSGQTVVRYLDLLVDLLLVRGLSPWSGNVAKRLVKSPKVFVRDSGIVHALLNIGTLNDVLGHPVAGATWEGMVLESVVAAAPDAHVSYFRTAAGAAADIVIELPRGVVVLVAVKRSTAPQVGKGFYSARRDVGATHSIVVYPGAERFPLPDDVEAIGVRDAIQFIRQVAS
jgi:predicted AAA+ superfamily ATPase